MDAGRVERNRTAVAKDEHLNPDGGRVENC
jgi:hypothetical protein